MAIPIWVLVMSKFNREAHDCIEVIYRDSQNSTEMDNSNRDNEFWMLVNFLISFRLCLLMFQELNF